MIFSKYIMGWPSMINRPQANDTAKPKKNISTTSVGSLTALKTFSARSQMALQMSGGPDTIAPLLIGNVSLFGPNIPGSYFFTHIYLFLARCHYYLTGRMFADQLAECCFKRVMRLGEIACLQARTCWLDDVVDTFADENKGTQFNVVILGAGYDTRCYRLRSITKKENIHLFEVDAPGTQQMKRNALKHAKIECSGVHFVSCDFEHEDWMKCLESQSNFNHNLPTIFVWEGVSMYVDREVVISIISQISRCAVGSCIAFDYVFSDCMNAALKKSAEKIGEPWKFAINFDEVENLIEECQELTQRKVALRVLDHLRKDEMKKRYLAKYSNGNHVGYLEEFGAFCLVGI
ncbi:hypothetical protein HJC23_004656 [Cyclotella cryptica]|uniref:Uncharacterized protein n=1 Tax=Cyclotella cryptica TaxID=29204 RepID=A0ABD3PKK2_9STRA